MNGNTMIIVGEYCNKKRYSCNNDDYSIILMSIMCIVIIANADEYYLFLQFIVGTHRLLLIYAIWFALDHCKRNRNTLKTTSIPSGN